jgi:hypothetical protein
MDMRNYANNLLSMLVWIDLPKHTNLRVRIPASPNHFRRFCALYFSSLEKACISFIENLFRLNYSLLLVVVKGPK